MMTACDLGAVTKPWDISRKVLFGTKLRFPVAVFLHKIPEVSSRLTVNIYFYPPVVVLTLLNNWQPWIQDTVA